MPLTPVPQAEVICRDRSGREVARILIAPADDSPLARLDPGEARAHNEAEVQLVETSHYEYRLTSAMPGLRVSYPPIFRAHRLQPGAGEQGLIETGSYCGQLRIEVVSVDSTHIVGSGKVEVRSVKLGYRDDYRWMLEDIAGHMMALLYDARAPMFTPLTTAWSRDPDLLQQQVAFLCETLDSADFHAALQRVLAFPHQRLTPETAMQPIQRTFKATRHLEWQLARSDQQVRIPASHSLAPRIASLPARVAIPARHSDLDTPENQFVKHVLTAFRSFLLHAEGVMRTQGDAWRAAADRARRTVNDADHWLAHALFQEVSALRAVPFSSHVLQRKPGYRDVLRTWLRFHAGAQLVWEASDDLFRTGQRNVATLYEYWLFFQLLDWFCQRFDLATPPATSLVTHAADKLICTLRHGRALGPFKGAAGDVRAQFRYNYTFDAPGGSWTRPMRPDFTITFWRVDALSEPTHLHFDAKYRVDKPADIFGAADSPDNGDDASNAKRDDLLKMHAYRDAIRNTTGAYVLYPGRAAPLLLRRGGGVLPSLGAFAVAPGPNGCAGGMEQVVAFLDEVIQAL